MQNPLVSVHMITYNQALYVAQAIESIVAQKTNFFFELVIGEDCSTDNTRDVVLEYKKLYPDIIQLITSDNNVGVVNNTRRVTAACKGKYIAYCEGDDFWHNPNKLQKQVDFLESNSDYGLVHSDYNLFYEVTQKTIENYNDNHAIIIPEGFIYEELLNPQKYIIKTPTACFRKEFLTNYFSYDVMQQRNWKLDDLPLWLEIAKHLKIKYIPESLATYRIMAESVSHTSNASKRHQFHLMVYDIRKYYSGKYGCSLNNQKNIECSHQRVLLSDGFALGDKAMVVDAINFLKKNNAKISLKEYAYFIGTQNSIFNKVLKTLNNITK